MKKDKNGVKIINRLSQKTAVSAGEQARENGWNTYFVTLTGAPVPYEYAEKAQNVMLDDFLKVHDEFFYTGFIKGAVIISDRPEPITDFFVPYVHMFAIVEGRLTAYEIQQIYYNNSRLKDMPTCDMRSNADQAGLVDKFNACIERSSAKRVYIHTSGILKST